MNAAVDAAGGMVVAQEGEWWTALAEKKAANAKVVPSCMYVCMYVEMPSGVSSYIGGCR